MLDVNREIFLQRSELYCSTVAHVKDRSTSSLISTWRLNWTVELRVIFLIKCHFFSFYGFLLRCLELITRQCFTFSTIYKASAHYPLPTPHCHLHGRLTDKSNIPMLLSLIKKNNEPLTVINIDAPNPNVVFIVRSCPQSCELNICICEHSRQSDVM